MLDKGKPPLVCFPSFGYAEIHPFVALPNDLGVSPVATGDQGYAPWMAPLFEKKLGKKLQPWFAKMLRGEPLALRGEPLALRGE